MALKPKSNWHHQWKQKGKKVTGTTNRLWQRKLAHKLITEGKYINFYEEALMVEVITLIYLTSAQVSFKEPVELGKLMTALDECIMFNQTETKKKMKNSRTKALLPQVSIGGRVEQNDLETNKLAENSPYLLSNFKNGWAIELNLKWSLDELMFSKDEQTIQKEYQNNLERYITLQNNLVETYHRIKDVIKRVSEIKDQKEIEVLSEEYNILNARINILTCHKYKTIQEKED